MHAKKICMLGTSGVGKTSLVSRFVHSIFSDKYLTTIGVKIDKKTLRVGDVEVTLIIWDLSGDDHFQPLHTSYLRDTSAYFLVADGTRPITLDLLTDIQRRVVEAIGRVPFVLLLNKADLATQWKIGDDRLAALSASGWSPLLTSAKSGSGVEEAFFTIASSIIFAKS